jgi:predicted RND superfamily exporter protein
VTGNPVQTFEASFEMKRSYEQATLYSFLVVVAVIFLDCGSIRWTLFALVPLGMGVLQMFGLLGLMNIPLNAANMIAVPIILGVGVDYGLHVIYDFRQQTGPYRISPSTALSVMVDALTTSVGFGALMIANHQGLQSLGRVLAIGTTCCLCCAIGFLPALLTWATRDREEVAEEAAEEHGTVTSFVIEGDSADKEQEHATASELLISPAPRISAPLSAFGA